MKILLASCFYMHNYGSQLQAVASEYILQKYSDSVVTVNCSNPKNFMEESKAKYYLKRIFSLYSLQNKVSGLLGSVRCKFDEKYNTNMKLRYHAFDKYISCHYNLSDKVNSKDEFFTLTQSFDVIVVGSDMLWNPINIDQNYYTLSHACDSIKKISLATSIGTSVIEDKYKEKYKDFLSKFDAISVREQSAVDIVNTLLNVKSTVLVVDPTLQLTASEWDKLINNDDDMKVVSEEYIFAYFLGKNPKHREIVKKYAREHNLKIVSIEHVDGYTSADKDFGDFSLYDCDPSQFITYIKGAKCMFTDSFHCCAFSIIYEKEFYVFDRFDSKDNVRNNTRIDNLLNMTALQERRVISEINARGYIDYNVVTKRIDKYRKEAELFLKGCLDHD